MLVRANLMKDVEQECIAKQEEKGEEKGRWGYQWRLIERRISDLAIPIKYPTGSVYVELDF